MMTWLEDALGKWVIKHRWMVIVITVLFVLAAAHGTRYLGFNNDTRVFFSEDNPQLKALEELENTYSKKYNIVFAIAPEDGNVFTRETLAAIEELTDASWEIPYSSRVDSITNFQHTEAEEDDLVVEDLVRDAGSLSATDISRIKRIALSEPFLVNNLVSPSGQVASVNVNIILPGKSMVETTEASSFAHHIADGLRQKHPDIKVYLTGGIILDDSFSKASRDDMSTLVPAMFIVLIAIVGISLRSFTGILGTTLIILFSMATSLGLAGWSGILLNAASVNAPTIILTLAVADSVHIMVTIFNLMRHGMNKNDAIAESLRINLQPVFLTSITTAIGFLSMNFSDAPPFRDVGNMVAMGVIAAFIYSIFFLPALLAVLPLKIKTKEVKRADIHKPCDRLADFVIRHRTSLFWGMMAAVVVLTSGMVKIELNDDFIRYFSKRYEVRRASDFVEQNLTGLNIIEYSLDSGEAGGINNPAYLNKVEEFAAWYRKQPKVIHVNTITDTLKRLNKSMHGDDQSFYGIPGSRELAAQYLLLYEMSLPFGLDLNDGINVDRSATRLVVSVKDVTTAALRNLDERARAWLRANAPESMFTYGSGISIIWAHLYMRNIKSMLGASFGALVLISAILIIALRSFKFGLISLLPNLSPALMSFGIWGLFVGQVGLVISVIVAMTLGIVVDDTIHFMSKYLRARREHDMTPWDAVHYSFNSVGTAMWVTTAALVAGFLVLTMSGFKINSVMGLMTALTITIALVLDFLFLPVLLMRADRK